MTYFQKLRVEWIVESLIIFGAIRREHVVLKFGVTQQIASSDFKTVMQMYPGIMTYDASAKTYKFNPE